MNAIPDETINGPSPYAPALIKLLQGVVYSDDHDIWGLVLRYQTPIATYFSRMGLQLYLNENDGFVYLTQPNLEEDGKLQELPRLTRRRELTYSVTLVLVLLREELNQFDSSNVENKKLTIPHEYLIDLMRPFYAVREDERTLIRNMEKDINQVVEMGFIKRIEIDKQAHYLVRPILKARVNSDELDRLKVQLESHTRNESR